MFGFLRQSFGPGWALVGDAGYFKDPITAHGITDALRDAELLSRAVAQDTESALAEYQETRDQLSYALFELTNDVAGYKWDLESVKRMHLQMSEEMNREVAFLTELHEELALRTT
jgi:flavin-dependent dehydrogenase